MKVWTRVRIKDRNKQVELISKAFTNYILASGPINDLYLKYQVNGADIHIINQYTVNRVAGLLMLYLSRDFDRVNDIANKYNMDASRYTEIIPEIEGYIEK